jgi:hypothetical protein
VSFIAHNRYLLVFLFPPPHLAYIVFIVVTNDLHAVKQKPCKLCGTNRRQFEPPVLYCASMSCDAPRIQRNATYYSYGSNQNCWCEQCYRKLSDSKVITLDDGGEILKSRLLPSRHDSLPEEVWIECDECHSRVHQICALYNGRMSKPNSVFWCPTCVRKNEGKPREIPNRAVHLPKCSMSDFMEAGLQKTLATAYKKKAVETGCSIDDLQKAEGLCIRVISHIEKKHVVREEVSLVESIWIISSFENHSLHFDSFFRCINDIPEMAARQTFLSIRNVWDYSSHSMGSMCSCLRCTYTSTETIALHPIAEECTFHIWIRCSISSPRHTVALSISL